MEEKLFFSELSEACLLITLILYESNATLIPYIIFS